MIKYLLNRKILLKQGCNSVEVNMFSNFRLSTDSSQVVQVIRFIVDLRSFLMSLSLLKLLFADAIFAIAVRNILKLTLRYCFLMRKNYGLIG